MYRVLIDNESSVNIMAYSIFQRLGLLDKELLPTNNELYGFMGDRVQIMGKVKLPLTLGAESMAITQITEFMVVYEDISYKTILGKPVLREFKVVTSIYHFSI